MQAPREIELKLECEPDALSALAGHGLLRTEAAAEPERLEATYYDTPGLDLRKAGVALRVRHENGAWKQTLKAASTSTGLFDRPEWEWAVPGSDVDPGLLDDTAASPVLARANSSELRPVLTTIVDRTSRPIRHGASDIVVTLDQGRVQTAAGDVPLCEVELELQSGAPVDLFGLARALSETAPLRLGVLSKSERGFALMDGSLRKPHKWEHREHAADATAGDVFAATAHGCLRHLRLNEAVFQHGFDPEALHQMRVALRRLRSAITLFKPILAQDAEAATLRERIKRMTEPFGHARNLDVFVAETLPAEMARRPDEPSLEQLRERVEAERSRARDGVVGVVESQEWRSLLIELVTWIETGAWRGAADHDRPAADFAAEILDRLRRRVKKRGRDLDRLTDEERHRVRIDAKKLRYGSDFFGSLFPEKKARKRQKAFVAALSELQDLLGSLNDLATAHGIVDGLIGKADDGRAAANGAALFAAGLTQADSEHHATGALRDAANAHAGLVRLKPFWR